jgi:hypothetical protein
MTTELELKKWLAEQLPEKIQRYGSNGRYFWYWHDEKDLSHDIESILDGAIKETEWEHIVRLVENKLPASKLLAYGEALANKCKDQSAFQDWYEVIYLVSKLPWPFRVQALKQVWSK